MSLAIVGVAAVVGDFGLSMAAIQSQDITHNQRSNLFWTNTAIGILMFAASFAAAPFMADFYGDSQLVDITRVLAVTFLLNALSAQFRAEVSVQLRFSYLAAVDVVAAGLALAVALVLAWQGLGWWALVAQQVSVSAVTLLALVVGARWLPGLPRRGQQMRALYTYGANTFGVQLLQYVTGNLDAVLLGRFWGADQLGAYDRANKLFRLPFQQIAAPLTRVALPILSKTQSESRYEPYLQRSQLLLGYALGASSIMLAGLSAPLVDVLLGPGWDLAKPIFALLAIGGAFQGIGYVYYWIFLSRALTGVQLRWTVITRSATIGLLLLAVPWGAIGIAAASALGQLLNWALLTLFPMRRAGVRRAPLVAAGLRPVLLFAPAAVACWILSQTVLAGIDGWQSLLILAAGTLVYAAAGVLVPRIREDYTHLWDVVRRLRH